MDPIDAIFKPALDAGLIHGVTLHAHDVNGNLSLNRQYGVSRLQDPLPMAPSTPMRLASATKLLTSIIALQCVSRGEVTLDQALESLLPEVAQLQVITGFDEDGQPVTRPPKTPVTLRHLLSHSSGLEYAIINPLLTRFRKDQGLEVEQEYDNLDENFRYPLSFDPGSDWAYGPSLDWTSRLIARASGLDAETYLRKYMTQPLGVEPWELTFNLIQYPEANARHAEAILRNADGSLTEDKDVKYWTRVEEPSGGQGIFATSRAYAKVLQSLLLDDGKLLDSATRALLFTPALTAESQKGLEACFVKLRAAHIGEPVPSETGKTYGLGGMLLTDDAEPGDPEAFRRKGSLSWAGATNYFWNVDPEAGICILWAFHLKPFGDEVCVELGEKFERAVYQILREAKRGGRR